VNRIQIPIPKLLITMPMANKLFPKLKRRRQRPRLKLPMKLSSQKPLLEMLKKPRKRKLEAEQKLKRVKREQLLVDLQLPS
jgi:hypothetical protein